MYMYCPKRSPDADTYFSLFVGDLQISGPDNGGSLSFYHPGRSPYECFRRPFIQNHQDDDAGHTVSNETRRQDCHRRRPANKAHGPHQPTRYYLNDVCC